MSENVREFRAWPVGSGVEFRVDRDDDGARLVGVSPPWEVLSEEIFGFWEKFSRGAFGDLSDVIATVEHDNARLIGRTPKTLRIKDDEAGLRYEVDLPGTTVADDLVELIERGDIRGSSFEFRVKAGGDEWEEDDDGRVIRTITDAELFQVGPVTRPAYADAPEVSLRSRDAFLEQRHVAEKLGVPVSVLRRRLDLTALDV